jgi:hypothetical protein
MTNGKIKRNCDYCYLQLLLQAGIIMRTHRIKKVVRCKSRLNKDYAKRHTAAVGFWVGFSVGAAVGLFVGRGVGLVVGVWVSTIVS